MFKFELGILAKEKIAGFEGVITGRAEYLTGCRKYAIQPQKLTKDGKTTDWEWVDESMVEVVKGKGFKKDPSGDEPGGPMKHLAPKA